MNKKRAIVLVLLVISLLSVLALAESDNAYYTAFVCFSENNEDACEDLDMNTIKWDRLGDAFENCGGKECQQSADPADQGCWWNAAEKKGTTNCAWAQIPEGTILRPDVWFDVRGNHLARDWGGDDDVKCGVDNYNFFNSGTAKICASDHLWYACTDDNYGEVVRVGEGDTEEIYVCIDNDWYDYNDLDENADADNDGVPNLLDCAPDRGDIHGSFGCTEEVRITTSTDGAEIGQICLPDGTCPISSDTCGDDGACYHTECVQGAADDICSDGIDNTCAGWDGITANYNFENYNDDCDQNEYSCLNYCTSQTGTCSWIDANNFNNCCGDDPLVDFGQITEGRRNVDAGEGTSNYLCLNAEMGNVATFTPIPIGVDDAGTEIQDCQGDWCWARAEEQKSP